jgi:hypothetical protein
MDRVTLHPEHGVLSSYPPLFVLLAFHRAVGRRQLGHLGGGKECEQDQHHRDELGVGNGGGKFGCRRGGGGAWSRATRDGGRSVRWRSWASSSSHAAGAAHHSLARTRLPAHGRRAAEAPRRVDGSARQQRQDHVHTDGSARRRQHLPRVRLPRPWWLVLPRLLPLTAARHRLQASMAWEGEPGGENSATVGEGDSSVGVKASADPEKIEFNFISWEP